MISPRTGTSHSPQFTLTNIYKQSPWQHRPVLSVGSRQTADYTKVLEGFRCETNSSYQCVSQSDRAHHISMNVIRIFGSKIVASADLGLDKEGL